MDAKINLYYFCIDCGFELCNDRLRRNNWYITNKIILSYLLKTRKNIENKNTKNANTSNGTTVLLQKSAVVKVKTQDLSKKQEKSGLLRKLRIKRSLSKVPILGANLF